MNKLSVNRNLSIDDFWEELKGCYKSLNFRCIATKEGDFWKNVFFTAFLSRRSVENVRKETEQNQSFLVNLGINKIEELGVFSEVTEAQNTPAYIKQMQSGQITLGNNSIHLREGWEKSSLYDGLRTIKFGEYAEYPIINYEFYSKDASSISEGLRNELLSLGLLYTIDELANIWLKMPSVTNYALNGIVIFPLYFNVIDVSFRDNREFIVKLKLHKYLYPKLTMLIALRRQMEGNYAVMENKRISFNEISPTIFDEDFLMCEVKSTFNISPQDEVYFRISSKLGILHHDLILIQDLIKRKEFKEAPVFKKLTSSYLEKYGYKYSANYSVGNINSLEWHLYHLLSPIFPIIWIGLKEEFWKDVFKEELGLDETVDFISFSDNSIILVECIQKYTTDKGEIGERGIRKLLYLKEKISKLGFIVYPILVCGENYEDNKAYFEGKLREDVYFIFNEGLKQMLKEMDLIKKPEDLVRYCKGKVASITSY
jgi:hypothetical protein